jgi:hypothetical protein
VPEEHRRSLQQAVSERFTAGVEVYLIWRPDGPMSAPVLLLIGDKAGPVAKILRATSPCRFEPVRSY